MLYYTLRRLRTAPAVLGRNFLFLLESLEREGRGGVALRTLVALLVLGRVYPGRRGEGLVMLSLRATLGGVLGGALSGDTASCAQVLASSSSSSMERGEMVASSMVFPAVEVAARDASGGGPALSAEGVVVGARQEPWTSATASAFLLGLLRILPPL